MVSVGTGDNRHVQNLGECFVQAGIDLKPERGDMETVLPPELVDVPNEVHDSVNWLSVYGLSCDSISKGERRARR